MAQQQGLTDQELEALDSKGLTDEELNSMEGSHGATGSWDQPIHPAVRAVLEPLANFGKAATEAGYNIVHSPVDILKASGAPVVGTSPQTEGEKTAGKFGYLPLLTHRLIIQPTVDNAKAWWDNLNEMSRINNAGEYDSKMAEATANAMGMIPVAGPVIKDVLDTAREKGLAAGAGKATGYGLAPKVGEEAKGLIPNNLRSESIPLVTKALSPSDPRFQEFVPKGLDEVKAAEKEAGTKFTKVEDWQKGLNDRYKGYEKDIDKMVDKQAHVKVPGSRDAIVKSQIDAIPADTPPTKRANLRREILNRYPDDLTIGELNKLRSELSATQSSFYGKDISGQLTMDAGSRAVDIARGETVRNLFYDALDKHGLGKGTEVRELNSRIGSIIHMQDALRSKLNAAVSQRQGVIGSAIDKIRGNTNIDKDLSTALDRWDRLPRPVDTTVIGRIGTGPDTSYVKGTGTTPPGVPNRISGTKPDASKVGVVTNPAEQARLLRARKAIPERTGGPIALPEDMNPPQAQAGVKGIPGELAKGPFSGKPITGKQIPLQPTVIKPTGRPSTPIFGERQNTLGQTNEALRGTTPGSIPAGVKLAFKSKSLQGTELYHYETPDGKIITLDYELTPDEMMGGKKSPYELSKPPVRKSKKKL